MASYQLCFCEFLQFYNEFYLFNVNVYFQFILKKSVIKLPILFVKKMLKHKIMQSKLISVKSKQQAEKVHFRALK